MLHTGILLNIPMKSCTYPWFLRLPPVQFTRVMVASLVSAPATRAVYRSFRPQCRDGSIWRCWFRQSCCVEWFSHWLVLRLFPLPRNAVCHTFVLARAALDQTGYASNSALSVFFLCQLKCCNASKAHWSHVLSAFTIITISIRVSVCEIHRNGH